MNKKTIIKVMLLIITHFMVTSLIGHYIAVQIGTQMGQVVAGGLSAASDKTKAEVEATTIFQNMKSQSNEIKAKWQIPELIISLPAKPAINVLLKDMRENQMKIYIAKEITRDDFRTRGLIADYAATFLNSLVLGVLVYVSLRIINKYKRER